MPNEFKEEGDKPRLLAGAARALAEHGYANLRVEQIVAEADVSRATFYEHFESKRDCVLAAHDVAFGRLASVLGEVCASESSWPDRIALAMTAVVDHVAAAPAEAQLLALDAIGADRLLAQRAIASADCLADLLRAGRGESELEAELPELTERALVGAATSVIGSRLIADQADSLPALKPQLIELMLMPYVGLDEARRLSSSAA